MKKKSIEENKDIGIKDIEVSCEHAIIYKKIYIVNKTVNIVNLTRFNYQLYFRVENMTKYIKIKYKKYILYIKILNIKSNSLKSIIAFFKGSYLIIINNLLSEQDKQKELHEVIKYIKAGKLFNKNYRSGGFKNGNWRI